jgi:hypothetical protein
LLLLVAYFVAYFERRGLYRDRLIAVLREACIALGTPYPAPVARPSPATAEAKQKRHGD